MQLVHTNDHQEACRLRDAGYEPVECAFGQLGSVLGPLALDHHGTERHREGVAIRACRDLYGARRDDPRFVVTGTPDADAVLAIIALSGVVAEHLIPQSFYELVDRQDTDPIGLDLFADERDGVGLAWFNQQPEMTQSEKGFRRGIERMSHLLEHGLTPEVRKQVKKTDLSRRRRAIEGILARYAEDGTRLPVPPDLSGLPVLRGEEAAAASARVLVVTSTVWGFDQWYRLAPIVVSYASRIAKVTVGCPDVPTSERLFGPGGLMRVWERLGTGWGGREAIGGSPRGQRLREGDATDTARSILRLLREGR